MNAITGSTLVRTALVLAIVAAGACTGGDRAGGPGGGGPGGDGPPLQLVSALRSFEACDELLDYLHREGARLVGPHGLEGGGVVALGARRSAAALDATTGAAEQAAPEAGQDFSGTNVQEAGVDEPDLVKTDGRRLVALTGGALKVVDVSGATPRLLSTLPIAQGHGEAQLFLAGDRVLVLHAAGPPGVDLPQPEPGVRDLASPMVVVPPYPSEARVTVVDIADPAAPTVASELSLDGSLVSARMVDGVARLVLRSDGPRIAFTYPNSDQAIDGAREANRQALESSSLDDWLPGYTYTEPGRAGATASGRLGDCRQVARPAEFSGLGMVSVLTVDAGDPRPGPAATVVGAGELVYASAGNLYVTTTRWTEPVPAPPGGVAPQKLAPATTTEIHAFDIADPVTTTYRASGQVPGRLLNQFSLSEHEGHLRVATTTDGISRGADEPGASESQVVVLRRDGPALTVVGSVGGLGRGERIYAVRFLGDRGYVVTFRQIDPLYVVDLADPAAPAVRGELKIPGYSAYLHPVGEHRLLGVGQEATEQGRPLGTQLSLFDVSDPADPERLAHTVVGQASSEAEFDHHAFLHWPRTGLTVVPVQIHGPLTTGRPGTAPPDYQPPFMGAIGFVVGDGEVKEVGRLQHPDGQPVRRSLVVGDRLLTLSEGGLLASDLETLGRQAWLAL